jgi:hypothetical protein
VEDEPFRFHTFNVVAGGITLNYTFPIDDLDSDGAEIRVTAELQGDGFPWNTAQPAALPSDPSDRFSFEPGTWISDVNFTIQLDAAADTGGR